MIADADPLFALPGPAVPPPAIDIAQAVDLFGICGVVSGLEVKVQVGQ